MKHHQIEITKATPLGKGWQMRCPVCGNVVASGMKGVVSPKWAVCTGDVVGKLGINTLKKRQHEKRNV